MVPRRRTWSTTMRGFDSGDSNAPTKTLIPNGPGTGGLKGLGARIRGSFLSHSAAAGALPTLFAATAPQATPLGYYGPNGFYELKGPVAPAKISPQAKDEAAARKLWEVSERLTGVPWPAEGRELVSFAAKKEA